VSATVLMTADTVGGVWRYAVELVRELDAEVTLATMGAPLSPEQRAEAPCRVEESSFALEWMDDPWEDVERAGEWLLGLAEEVRPDIVHLNGYAHAALPWEAPVLLVAHSDVVTWWEAVRGETPPPEWDRYRAAVQEGLLAADAVAAPTWALLDALHRHYDLVGDPYVVPNGRTPLAPRPKEPYVVAAGRFWDEAKGLDAIRRVESRLPWPVRVAGAEGQAPAREVEELLARASIFVSPARYEPFGLAALEAASAGCALVLSDLASFREVWGDAATYVPPGDDGALAEALLRLIEDDRLREELGGQARSRSRRYAPEAAAAEYELLYARLAARVGAR
jgi:glycogen synthase